MFGKIWNVGAVHGGVRNSAVLNKSDVMVITAQKFFNMISSEAFPLSNCVCIIIDNPHKACRCHPALELLKKYRNELRIMSSKSATGEPPKLRIIALTDAIGPYGMCIDTVKAQVAAGQVNPTPNVDVTTGQPCISFDDDEMEENLARVSMCMQVKPMYPSNVLDKCITVACGTAEPLLDQYKRLKITGTYYFMEHADVAMAGLRRALFSCYQTLASKCIFRLPAVQTADHLFHPTVKRLIQQRFRVLESAEDRGVFKDIPGRVALPTDEILITNTVQEGRHEAYQTLLIQQLENLRNIMHILEAEAVLRDCVRDVVCVAFIDRVVEQLWRMQCPRS